MSQTESQNLSYETVTLGGVTYAIVRESLLQELCRRAGVTPSGPKPDRSPVQIGLADVDDLDRERLARRLTLRRKRAGLTQAELARRAGIRVETLNRVERARTTPDFSTIRKLVVAMNEVEAELPV